MILSRRALLAAPALLLAPPRLGRADGGRVVCVGGALTECAFALGEGDRIVAVDTTSLYPAAARARPRIGYLRSLPTEGILSLSPDLLLLSDEAGPPGAVAVLRAAQLPVVTVADRAGQGAAEAKITAVGSALGADATAIASAMAADWRLLDAPIAAVRSPPRVLFVLSLARGAPLVSGAGTHADVAIAAAGGVNVVRQWQGYRPLSAEAAAALAPDVILFMTHVLEEAGGPAVAAQSTALAVTPAGRAGRVVALDGPLMLGFGPRAAAGRAALAALLHPGLTLQSLPERPWTAA